jgi:hypothetical protein
MIQQTDPKTVTAERVLRLTSATASADGSHSILSFKQLDSDEPLNIAIPPDEIPSLITLASQAGREAKRISLSKQTIKHVMPVDWWDVGGEIGGPDVFLTCRIVGGCELSFRFSYEAAERLYEVLGSFLGHSDIRPGTVTN